MNATYQQHLKFMLRDGTWPAFHSHLHMHCEIMYVKEGSVETVIDGVHYTANKNEAIFVLPHQIHSFESKTHNEVYVMFVSPLLLPKYSELIKTNVLESPIIKLKKDSTVNICNNIVNYLYELFPGISEYPDKRQTDNKAVTNSTLAGSLVESYVSILLDGASWKKKTVSATDTARKVIEYCLSHYKEDISIFRIAEALGVTEHTVTRVFTGLLGCNFRKYINHLRLSEVVQKLSETSLPITDIAKECGFDTLRTFNRVFVSEYGMTPSEYRKKRIH